MIQFTEQKLKEVALMDMGDLEINHLKIVKKNMQKRKKNEIIFLHSFVYNRKMLRPKMQQWQYKTRM